jgi:hypothetical protein
LDENGGILQKQIHLLKAQGDIVTQNGLRRREDQFGLRIGMKRVHKYILISL